MDKLEDLKTSFYQAALGEEDWTAAARGVRGMLDADLIAVSTLDAASGQDRLLYGDCGVHYSELYRRLQAANPFVPAVRTLRLGQIVTDTCLLERRNFRRTTFFDEWMRPQHQHSAAVMNLCWSGATGSYLMISRGGRIERFGEADMEVLNAIQPTMRHAMDLHIRLARSRLQQTGAVLDGQAIGWLAVEKNGRISWANQTADAILAGPDGALSARHSMLRAFDPAQSQRLLSALRAAMGEFPAPGQGSNLIFRNPESGAAIAASFIPGHHLFVKGLPELNGAYLALQDLAMRLPPDLAARVGTMFNLTVRETELAVALIEGKSPAESALARGLSLPTVRTQLAQLLRKTGTARQSQLVALLLSTLPVPFAG